MKEGELNKALNDATEKITELTKENRKLEDKIVMLETQNVVMKDRLKFGYKGVTREEIEACELENRVLKEKIETLELWLDNKEKLNEEYRKQLDKYKLK